MRILVTAGPTREYLDAVRYISNASSGAMGHAIAAETARRGHHVLLVSGPVALPPPPDVEFVSVVSAAEMADVCRVRFLECDAAVMCAAVCDYRPAAPAAGKPPKKASGRSVELTPTEDICAALGQMKGDKRGQAPRGTVLPASHATARSEPVPFRQRILVGFALETDDGRRRAEAKLREKRCDAIVLNHPSGIGRDDTTIEVFTTASGWSPPRTDNKTVLAAHLVDVVEQLAAESEP